MILINVRGPKSYLSAKNMCSSVIRDRDPALNTVKHLFVCSLFAPVPWRAVMKAIHPRFVSFP